VAIHWYLLSVLFLVPFVDPQRPFRLLHVDLLALIVVGFFPLRVSFSLDRPARSVILTVLALAYLFGRLLWSGFRVSERRGPLVPLAPVSWLVVAVVVLTGFRLAYVLGDQVPVGDVGGASAIGASLVADGGDVYGGEVNNFVPHGDTYGPVIYLSYVPFEQALPVGLEYAKADAARAAAVTFDLLTLLGLFLLGRRLRPGPDGQALGVALAFAWASYPYSLLVLRYSFNDALVALVLVGALLALHAPAGRGILAALATGTKFAPALLVPLFATATGERRLRPLLVFAPPSWRSSSRSSFP
jgi:Glycosyltransferase family 87